jgi:hypothetical protein
MPGEADPHGYSRWSLPRRIFPLWLRRQKSAVKDAEGVGDGRHPERGGAVPEVLLLLARAALRRLGTPPTTTCHAPMKSPFWSGTPS